MHQVTRIQDPLRIGSMVVPNRLFRAPLLEGAGLSKDPAQIYAKHFVPNAEAGVGLIVQGTVCVTPEGRPSPGMNAIDTRADMLAMAPMTDAVHKAGARIVTQLGHGGIYCVENWHADFKAQRKALPIAVSKPKGLPRFTAGKVHVMSTVEVEAMVKRFGLVALWAREAGYDGVEIAGCNAKLIQQFLSRTYNSRTDRFGGSLYRRTAFIREVRAAIAEAAGWDFPVSLKFPTQELHWSNKPGITADEGLEIATIAEEAGYDALIPVTAHAGPNPSFCRGEFPESSFGNVRLKRMFTDAMGAFRFWVLKRALRKVVDTHPFEPVWNRQIFSEVKSRVSIPVMAVGGIRKPSEADEILGKGQADLVGLGRPFYSDPDLAKIFLQRRHQDERLKCSNCNRCILPQLIGHPGVCYNPEVHRARALERKGLSPDLASA